jgi:hypothetical protein
MKEYSGEYSDQGRHYEAESNSDFRVFGDPPSIAVKTSAESCQARSLDKLQALRQTCSDCRFKSVASSGDIIVEFVTQ